MRPAGNSPGIARAGRLPNIDHPGRGTSKKSESMTRRSCVMIVAEPNDFVAEVQATVAIIDLLGANRTLALSRSKLLGWALSGARS